MGRRVSHKFCISRLADSHGEMDVEGGKKAIRDMKTMPLEDEHSREAEDICNAYDQLSSEFNFGYLVSRDEHYDNPVCIGYGSLAECDNLEEILNRLEELTDKEVADRHREFFKSDNVMIHEGVDLEM